jgi:hypothetical protein
MRTTSLHCYASAAAPAEYWSPAVPLLASSAPMGEKCTALRRVPSPGTSGGWASCQLCLDQDYQNASFRTHYVEPGDGDLAGFSQRRVWR